MTFRLGIWVLSGLLKGRWREVPEWMWDCSALPYLPFIILKKSSAAPSTWEWIIFLEVSSTCKNLATASIFWIAWYFPHFKEYLSSDCHLPPPYPSFRLIKKPIAMNTFKEAGVVIPRSLRYHATWLWKINFLTLEMERKLPSAAKSNIQMFLQQKTKNQIILWDRILHHCFLFCFSKSDVMSSFMFKELQ